MPGRQFAHFPGADQQHRLVLQCAENLAGQFDRGERDRNGVAGDIGFGTHPLGDRKGLVQEAVQDQSGGLVVGGIAVGRLDLTQDLGLADDHRVETGGDPKDVPDGVLALIVVEMGFEGLRIEVVEGGEKAFELRFARFGIPAGGVELHPVAGRDDYPLVDGR